ncbi:MAG: carboxypeptidase [Chitinophagaceae bacterium]
MSSQELYQQYQQTMRKIADVKFSSAVLQWDQETYLPPKAASIRGQQLATLSEIAHQLFSNEKLGQLLNQLVEKNDLSENEKRNIELTLEDYNKNKKYSSAFVRKLTEQINRSFHAWIESRKQNNFSVFETELDKLIDLKKQEADILGYQHHPYNALLNEYEKGATVDLIDRVFEKLLPAIKNIYEQIRKKPQVDDGFLKQHYAKQQQWDWGMWLIKQLHFDFEAGRQDISEHPFTTSFANTDVRITTRINENDFSSMTWSCIHEVGHALYEQGLPEEEYGLPLGEAASLGIHESQSRLWENNVGRSLAFWKFYFPELQKRFPNQLKNISVEAFYKAINKVEPSLIRTEADELTYHFNVVIRYELEKKLIEGSLKTSDIPAFWNEHYQSYLGISPTNDKSGCLQDVHWSHGSFGYFPTYSLGSLYAAQFFSTISSATNNSLQAIEQGDSRFILNWLRENIHSYGRKFTSEELCKRTTGTTLDIQYFVDYILLKYGLIYNL